VNKKTGESKTQFDSHLTPAIRNGFVEQMAALLDKYPDAASTLLEVTFASSPTSGDNPADESGNGTGGEDHANITQGVRRKFLLTPSLAAYVQPSGDTWDDKGKVMLNDLRKRDLQEMFAESKHSVVRTIRDVASHEFGHVLARSIHRDGETKSLQDHIDPVRGQRYYTIGLEERLQVIGALGTKRKVKIKDLPVDTRVRVRLGKEGLLEGIVQRQSPAEGSKKYLVTDDGEDLLWTLASKQILTQNKAVEVIAHPDYEIDNIGRVVRVGKVELMSDPKTFFDYPIGTVVANKEGYEYTKVDSDSWLGESDGMSQAIDSKVLSTRFKTYTTDSVNATPELMGWGLFRDSGISPDDIAAISKYGATSPTEAFAELFAAYEGIPHHSKTKMSDELRQKFESLLANFGIQAQPKGV
jgi:hypothetical protein